MTCLTFGRLGKPGAVIKDFSTLPIRSLRSRSLISSFKSRAFSVSAWNFFASSLNLKEIKENQLNGYQKFLFLIDPVHNWEFLYRLF